jgi:serine/threonine protein kinase
MEDSDISQKSITSKRGFKFWDKSYFQFVATISAEIADALSYAHQNGIVHGDLKPSNILLTHEAIPMVVDFGLSRNIKKIASMKTSEFAGTLAYAAPEQAKENTVNEKTDIWSLGITLYELLTFRNPFTSDTVKQTIEKISKCNIPLLRSYNKKIPTELEAIVLKCLEYNPTHRYISIAELSEDLNNYLTSKPTKARPIGPIRKTGKLFRRHPLLSFVTISLVFSLLISSVIMVNKKISDMISDAKSTYENGHYDQALSKYDNIISLIQRLPFNEGRYANIFCGIADTYYYKGQYLNSIEYYKKALNIDRRYYWAIVGIAATYYEIGNFDEALNFYKKAIEIRRTDRYNYYYIGKIYSAKKMWNEAIDNYRSAIELTPEEDSETLREIALIVITLGYSKKDEIETYLKSKKFSDKYIISVFKALQ